MQGWQAMRFTLSVGFPGADWRGTPFQPIRDRAYRGDVDAAPRCFGLIVWEAVMRHPERWSFGRYALNDIPLEGKRLGYRTREDCLCPLMLTVALQS